MLGHVVGYVFAYGPLLLLGCGIGYWVAVRRDRQRASVSAASDPEVLARLTGRGPAAPPRVVSGDVSTPPGPAGSLRPRDPWA